MILSKGRLLEVPPGLLPENVHFEVTLRDGEGGSAQVVREEDLRPLQEVETEHIERVVRACNGKISGDNGAAMKLAMHPNTLRSRMAKLGIKTRL